MNANSHEGDGRGRTFVERIPGRSLSCELGRNIEQISAWDKRRKGSLQVLASEMLTQRRWKWLLRNGGTLKWNLPELAELRGFFDGMV
jgi:hypothetical protein